MYDFSALLISGQWDSIFYSHEILVLGVVDVIRTISKITSGLDLFRFRACHQCVYCSVNWQSNSNLQAWAADSSDLALQGHFLNIRACICINSLIGPAISLESLPLAISVVTTIMRLTRHSLIKNPQWLPFLYQKNLSYQSVIDWFEKGIGSWLLPASPLFPWLTSSLDDPPTYTL